MSRLATAVLAAGILGLVTLAPTGCARGGRHTEAKPSLQSTDVKVESTAVDVSTDERWEVLGSRGAVATGNEASVDAGMRILQAGGNASDAAAATLLAQTVTEPTKYGLGGEVPIIVYRSKPRVIEVLCGQGEAPALATPEYFRSIHGIPGPGKNLDAANDPRNAAVPGAFHAIATLLERHGTMTFEAVAAPTVDLLKAYPDGWQADLARTMAILVEADVNARVAGGDRAGGINAAVAEFYGQDGRIAKRIAAWSEASGALLRPEDLANHKTAIEQPVYVDYRNYTVYKCGPWTQGPYLLETLNILEGYDLRDMGYNKVNYVHVAIEALKLGLADRDRYLADPRFADVPLAPMLSKKYAEERRGLIDMRHASLQVRPGDPSHGKALLDAEAMPSGPEYQKNDTTTCIVADRWGNVVVATPSGWGGAQAGDTGIWLGSRLSSFNLWEGHPNIIAPGKRPRTTLSPTLVVKGGVPVAAISVAGGDMQDQVTLNLLLDTVDFGMSPGRAVAAPRFGTSQMTGSFGQPAPKLGSLEVNKTIGPDVIDDLAARGHIIETWDGAYWAPSMMTFEPATGLIRAAGDPQASRRSAAW